MNTYQGFDFLQQNNPDNIELVPPPPPMAYVAGYPPMSPFQQPPPPMYRMSPPAFPPTSYRHSSPGSIGHPRMRTSTPGMDEFKSIRELFDGNDSDRTSPPVPNVVSSFINNVMASGPHPAPIEQPPMMYPGIGGPLVNPMPSGPFFHGPNQNVNLMFPPGDQQSPFRNNLFGPYPNHMSGPYPSHMSAPFRNHASGPFPGNMNMFFPNTAGAPVFNNTNMPYYNSGVVPYQQTVESPSRQNNSNASLNGESNAASPNGGSSQFQKNLNALAKIFEPACSKASAPPEATNKPAAKKSPVPRAITKAAAKSYDLPAPSKKKTPTKSSEVTASAATGRANAVVDKKVPKEEVVPYEVTIPAAIEQLYKPTAKPRQPENHGQAMTEIVNSVMNCMIDDKKTSKSSSIGEMIVNSSMASGTFLSHFCDDLKIPPPISVIEPEVQAYAENVPNIDLPGSSKPGSPLTLCEFFHSTLVDDLKHHLCNPWKFNERCGCCGDSPLHLAVRLNSNELVDIISRRANFNLVNNQGETALHVACRLGKHSLAEMLIGGKTDPYIEDSNGNTPLDVCLKEHQLKIAESLLKRSIDLTKPTPHPYLHTAVRYGSRSFVELLIKHKATINEKDSTGHTATSLAIERNDEELLTMLLEAGADLEDTYENGQSLLHLACQKAREGCVRKLLFAGASVQAVDNGLSSPLHVAVRAGQLNTVQMLLLFNSDVEAEDKWLRTPLYIAILHNRPRMVMRLLSHGASTTNITAPLITALKSGANEMIRILVNHGLDLDQKDRLDQTLIRTAVVRNNESLVRYLLEKGAKANPEDEEPIVIDAIKLRNPRMVKLLMKYDVDITARDSHGKTPLDYAISLKDYDVVNIFIESQRPEIIDQLKEYPNLYRDMVNNIPDELQQQFIAISNDLRCICDFGA